MMVARYASTAQYPFDYGGTVDLHLSVNPVASDYPLDFRTESQIRSGALNQNSPTKAPSEESTQDMMRRAIERSGDGGDNWIFSGHPNTVRAITEGKQP
jgi:hypothetical protein